MLFRYPDPPASASEDIKAAWSELIRLLELRDSLTFSGPANPTSSLYTITNVSANRTFDVSAGQVNTSVVANALGTLLYDLNTKGYLA